MGMVGPGSSLASGAFRFQHSAFSAFASPSIPIFHYSIPLLCFSALLLCSGLVALPIEAR